MLPIAEVLRRQCDDRILIIDGAMGTMLQRHELTEADFRGSRFAAHPRDLQGNSDVLCLTRREIVQGVHREYLEAGADLIETNTFGATSIVQAEYGLEAFAYEMNVEAARLCREVCDEFTRRDPTRPRFVAGVLGPLNRTLSMSPKVEDPAYRAVTFEAVVRGYAEQVRGLLDGGAHLLLVETIFDTLNAKAALVAIDDVLSERGLSRETDVPLMISVTITDLSGRTLSGQTIEAFWLSIEHARPFSVGLNCALGGVQMRPFLVELSRVATTRLTCYPNAGLPNAFGGFDEDPCTTGGLLRGFAQEGLVNMVGGCCGTTPDHIREIAAHVAGLPPRPLPKATDGFGAFARFSGLEPFVMRDDGNEVLVADMTVAYKVVRETFTSRVTLDRPKLQILVEYLNGPFSRLENRWEFRATGERACDVVFFINYEFRSRMLGMMMGAVFDAAFRRFAEAFEKRADQVYGRG